MPDQITSLCPDELSELACAVSDASVSHWKSLKKVCKRVLAEMRDGLDNADWVAEYLRSNAEQNQQMHARENSGELGRTVGHTKNIALVCELVNSLASAQRIISRKTVVDTPMTLKSLEARAETLFKAARLANELMLRPDHRTISSLLQRTPANSTALKRLGMACRSGTTIARLEKKYAELRSEYEAGVRRLLTRIEDPLYWFLRRFFKPDDSQAEILATKLTIQALEEIRLTIHSYDKNRGGSAMAFFNCIAGRIYKRWRRSKSPKHVQWDDLGAIQQLGERDESADEDVQVQSSQLPRLDECLSELTSYGRAVILLRHYAGLKFPEIGDVLGSTKDAVRQVHCRAFRQLRECMNAGGAGRQ